MKAFNRQLLATSGLFVAFMGLTSFNPFTDTNHVTALQKEESISLAASSVERDAQIAPVGTARNRSEGLNAAIALQPKERDPRFAQSQVTAGPGVLDTIIRDPKNKNDGKEGRVDCTDGKCAESQTRSQTEALAAIAEKLKTNQPLTAEENKLAAEHISGRDNITVLETVEVVGSLCPGDGSYSAKDYKSRVSCLLDAEDALKGKSRRSSKHNSRRGSEETPEDRGVLQEKIADEIDSLIEEVAYDENLTAREVSRILGKLNRSKVVLADRELGLKESIRGAIAYANALKKRDLFERNLEKSTDYIVNLDDQIQQAMDANGGQKSYQSEMLVMERKNAVYNLEKEIAGFQHDYRQSLPAPRSNESELVGQLRDEMSADYQDLISPLSSVITDNRLTSLERTSFSLSSPNYVQSATAGTAGSAVFTSNDPRNIGQMNQGRPNYSSMDPYMSNANTQMLSQMTPAQQIQQLQGQLRNGGNQVPMMQQQQGPGQLSRI